MTSTNDYLGEPVDKLRIGFGKLAEEIANEGTIKNDAECADFLLSGCLNIIADMCVTLSEMTNRSSDQIKNMFIQNLRQVKFTTGNYH